VLFKNIIGQEEVKKRLIRSVKENRVSHAQLFLGPEGSGKLALALAYAQYICCENKQEDDSCGTCRSCVKYEKIAHPDLHFLYPFAATKDNPISKSWLPEWRKLVIENQGYISLADWYAAIGMETKQGIIYARDCDEVIKTLSLKTYESEYKIMVIWMIEKLFHAAAPKLLKILEEPPDKTLFLLVCENHEQVISTIISRTQMIKIPRIADIDLAHALTNLNGATPKRANEIIRVVEGNYLEARQLVSDMPDDSTFELLRDWMRLCYGNKVFELVDWVDNYSKAGREKQKSFLLNAIRVFRESMLVHTGKTELIRAEEQELDFATKFSPFINAKNTIQIIQEFNEAIFNIERNANPKIMFMDLSLKMTELLKVK
jgi:DNA polymerase III subunit delta'